MIHRQQFAILKKRIDLPGYKSIDMEDGWVLSYHEDLPVYLDKKSQTFLLGYAWQVLPERGTPEEELKKLAEAGNDHISESELLNCEESWNGRYVVISGGRVYLDANGMLNVFFSDAGGLPRNTADALYMRGKGGRGVPAVRRKPAVRRAAGY